MQKDEEIFEKYADEEAAIYETLNKIDEEKFWEIVKTGFAHKRKKLSSNLKNVILCQGQSLTYLGNKRAEDLSLEDWILLAKQ